MADHYAVIGNPIAHSKSPVIHAAFARQTRQHMDYGRILGNLDDFAGDVRRFVAEGGRGLNVTVPFKEQAFALLEDLSPRAEAAGAVNTIVVRDGGLLRGDNTDGVGLVRDLVSNHGIGIAGRRVLLLGAGGAARGVLQPLLEQGPAALQIANRTAAKAVELAELAVGFTADAHVRGSGLDGLDGQAFDLIINATSSGLAGDVPAIPDDCLADGGSIYDLLYGDVPTPFCRWGAARGAARILDGLGMLVEQAAESFLLWRGVRPDTAPVIAMLRGGGTP
ncbi:shikimate dehydrogenase [Thiohalocapsa marina]|uniref:Shikimate dehydrogenase (NADP(+)) n=1 Tax=Thiohalocapsa marina TaxID=424902 RepID=A0A5M8FE25_9GAMM|nr:shikimate dehydrogenase [Thiohalocapsa marina]KAA6182917.1 shikimate dehydrogenase [Thiohalocapsa marina]